MTPDAIRNVETLGLVVIAALVVFRSLGLGTASIPRPAKAASVSKGWVAEFAIVMFIWALGIGTMLGGLYIVVRFVKWAWAD